MSNDQTEKQVLEPENIEEMFKGDEPAPAAAESPAKPKKAGGGDLTEAELAVLFDKGVVGMDDQAAEDKRPERLPVEDPNVTELRKRRTWGC